MKGAGRLGLRTGLGMGALALFGGIGETIGVHLGVNLFNGFLLGTLGVPGFGLLLMLHWVLQG